MKFDSNFLSKHIKKLLLLERLSYFFSFLTKIFISIRQYLDFEARFTLAIPKHLSLPRRTALGLIVGRVETEIPEFPLTRSPILARLAVPFNSSDASLSPDDTRFVIRSSCAARLLPHSVTSGERDIDFDPLHQRSPIRGWRAIRWEFEAQCAQFVRARLGSSLFGLSLMASSSKQPKIDHFRAEWDTDYFFTGVKYKCACLLCREHERTTLLYKSLIRPIII